MTDYTATSLTATKLAFLGRGHYAEQTLVVAAFTNVHGETRYEAARETDGGLVSANVGSTYVSADEVLAAIARSDAATRAKRDGNPQRTGNVAERRAQAIGDGYGVGGQVWDE